MIIHCFADAIAWCTACCVSWTCFSIWDIIWDVRLWRLPVRAGRRKHMGNASNLRHGGNPPIDTTSNRHFSNAVAALWRATRGMRCINLGELVGNENASTAGDVGMLSESEESSDLGEPQMAVFKSSQKSDGMLVEPAGRTPESAYGRHIPPCPCLLKTPVDGITWTGSRGKLVRTPRSNQRLTSLAFRECSNNTGQCQMAPVQCEWKPKFSDLACLNEGLNTIVQNVKQFNSNVGTKWNFRYYQCRKQRYVSAVNM